MIIKSFRIMEQAKKGCDYVATEHIIDKQYELNVGDYIYAVSYMGRGCYAGFNFKIIAITEFGMSIEEDGNRKKFIAWKDEERDLRIYPFPTFRNGLGKKNFCDRSNSIKDFVYGINKRINKNNDWYKKYINNFKNIIQEDAGVQQELNLRMDCCI